MGLFGGSMVAFDGIMDDGLKVIVVTCNSCGNKMLWNYETKAHECNNCDCTVVLKTISEKDLQPIKKKANGNINISYSDYTIHKLSVSDVEKIKNEKNLEKKAIALKRRK